MSAPKLCENKLTGKHIDSSGETLLECIEGCRRAVRDAAEETALFIRLHRRN